MLNTTAKVLLAISLLATAGHIYAAEDSPSRVTMETSMGTIVIELDPRRAPTTTENFLRYVDDGYYDGLIFHRVIPSFMIQGGGFDVELTRHLADSNRWYPGAGHLDFKRIVEILAHTGYDGFLSAEILPQPDPDTCAQETIKTMRSILV